VIEITMPRLSDSMEEGTIVEWLVAVGDHVNEGDPLAEIETDKATMSFECDSAGEVTEIVVEAGSACAVGEVIARLREPGAEVDESPKRDEAALVAVEASSEQISAVATLEPRGAGGSGGRIKASPVARRMAEALGVDLAGLAGSGPHGRIVKVDVAAAAETNGAPTAEVPKPETTKGAVSHEEPSRLQQTVARRMAESKATVPDFALSLTVDMTEALEVRRRLKDVAEPAPSINDMVVKAAAVALRDHPRANAAFHDGRFELYGRVNIGVAVAGEGSLVVPTVFDADQKSLGEIARATRSLAEKARSGAITPAELADGTLTISNLGMFGVEQFTPIVNTPQAAILAVGAVVRRPAVDADDRIVPCDQMTLCLVCDHRILYGADGARYLADVKRLLERPLSLAL
jgi:pyruvate dehydrogenase E2 component (dihydrolipoamide acetyltransferase)